MDRPELGQLLSRLLEEVVRRERELFDRAGLGMWDYVILAALARQNAPTQAALAASTGRDKTRLIAHLDRLEKRGLISRLADPGDRRNRIVRLTVDGRGAYDHLHAAILEMEEQMMAGVAPADRATFLGVCATLVDDLGLGRG